MVEGEKGDEKEKEKGQKRSIHRRKVGRHGRRGMQEEGVIMVVMNGEREKIMKMI